MLPLRQLFSCHILFPVPAEELPGLPSLGPPSLPPEAAWVGPPATLGSVTTVGCGHYERRRERSGPSCSGKWPGPRQACWWREWTNEVGRPRGQGGPSLLTAVFLPPQWTGPWSRPTLRCSSTRASAAVQAPGPSCRRMFTLSLWSGASPGPSLGWWGIPLTARLSRGRRWVWVPGTSMGR